MKGLSIMGVSSWRILDEIIVVAAEVCFRVVVDTSSGMLLPADPDPSRAVHAVTLFWELSVFVRFAHVDTG